MTFVLSSLIGGVVGAVLGIASRRGRLSSAVPFGAVLAVAALVASLQGDPGIVRWYLSMYGY